MTNPPHGARRERLLTEADLAHWLNARRAELDYIDAQLAAIRPENGDGAAFDGLRHKLDAARIKLALVERVQGRERQRAIQDLERARQTLLEDARAMALRARRGRRPDA